MIIVASHNTLLYWSQLKYIYFASWKYYYETFRRLKTKTKDNSLEKSWTCPAVHDNVNFFF